VIDGLDGEAGTGARRWLERWMGMDGTSFESLEFNQCQEAVKRLNEFLSKELSHDEAETVQKHLSECRGCLEKFSFEEALLKTIRERAEQVVAPQTLRSRILGLLADDEMEPPTGSQPQYATRSDSAS
jgi:anti-sigma factor (TIGR02949 family)